MIIRLRYLIALFWVASGLREVPQGLRANNVVKLDDVLETKNLTAVVVAAKTVSNDTIQVTLEANISAATPQLGAAPPVNVRVVYAAHDALSQSLLAEGVTPLFTRSDILNVTTLSLIPFGMVSVLDVNSLSAGFLYWHPELKKANISAVYRCPNGEGECESSLIHACAIEAAQNDPRIYLPFVSCMSKVKAGTSPEDASFGCSNSTAFMASLRECALGPMGVRLQGSMAKDALSTHRTPAVAIGDAWHFFNTTQTAVGTELKNLVCDALFAEGKLDRDKCEDRTGDKSLTAPFQSIIPSGTPQVIVPTSTKH
jgi:hypothetical protein